MKKTIEIDGKEYELQGTVRESGGFAIHTDGGTFRMKPCKPKTGQSAFWMGEKGFAVDLPGECPQRISRITFDEPDLTDQYPDEVKADYRKYQAHCKKAGEKVLPFEWYKKEVAFSNVWKRHETTELAAQYGYIDDPFVFYSQNLEGQMIDPACLHKFKWKAEYMDESGQGEAVFFERLAGPDPLPGSLESKSQSDNADNNRNPDDCIYDDSGELVFRVLAPSFAEVEYRGVRYICPPKGRHVLETYWKHYQETGGSALSQDDVLGVDPGETLRDCFRDHLETWKALFAKRKGSKDIYDFLPVVVAQVNSA